MMNKYEQLGVVGEGSYGVVMKCRHKETGQLVAIKRFLETDEDLTVKKMALREIKILKKLRHENLVSMLDVFRRKRRFYLVFEYMDRTVLEELEAAGGGLPDEVIRRHVFQLLRAVEHCHANNIIHRDVKPENVLVSRLGVVKLCDFGFARLIPQSGEPYTEYVATRWYRAPELLLCDPKYGPEVDVWAVGCLFAEMMTGDPLFPGESDIDQLYLIVKVIGRLPTRQQQLLSRLPYMKAAILDMSNSSGGVSKSLKRLIPARKTSALALLAATLRADPLRRPPCRELLRHLYFTHDGFSDNFPAELRRRAQQENQTNPLLRKLQGTTNNNVDNAKRDSNDSEEIINRGIAPVSSNLQPSGHNALEEVSNKKRSRTDSKFAPPNAVYEYEKEYDKKYIDTASSPVTMLSSPVAISLYKHTSPLRIKNDNGSKIHPNTHQSIHVHSYHPKMQGLKSLPNNKHDQLSEDKMADSLRPLKTKRLSQDLVLPSVPGAILSPLKSSKSKLSTLDNMITVSQYKKGSENNSSRSRIETTSLPFM